jgi:hypothetical protein
MELGVHDANFKGLNMELGVHDANFKGLIRKLRKCATRKNFMQLLEGKYEVNAKNWLKILCNYWEGKYEINAKN